MVALTYFLLLLGFACLGRSAPMQESVSTTHVGPVKALCSFLPSTMMNKLCLHERRGRPSRQTVLGVAKGNEDPSGAQRFIVKYANSQRWEPSTLVSSWALPAGASDVTATPLACPQPFIDSSTYTEDCLSMVLYVPATLKTTDSAPAFMWIHGGSFIVGSASGAGLDGSKLAIATNSIVAVVQYRLGALGFMAPDGTTNLAVKDLVNALQFLKQVLPAFGGDPDKVTIAGQSSGACLVRTLLAVPSASSLFHQGIIQSDPMDFGFLAPPAQQTIQNLYNGFIGCSDSDKACQNNLSLDEIIDSQMALFGSAFQTVPVAGQSEPMRPVLDGSFITTSLDSTTPFPHVSKSLLVTTVADEAAFAIYSVNGAPLNRTGLTDACKTTFGENRTSVILSSPFYGSAPDSRTLLQEIGTDYLWKCSSWTFARNWAFSGGSVYVGEYVVGASYPGNDAVPECTQPGVVCHQDDIEIVFGTVPYPSPAQHALITEMQTRYRTFLHDGNPNVPNLRQWPSARSSDVNAIQLGGKGSVPVGACTPSFWGAAVQYDYQFFANA